MTDQDPSNRNITETGREARQGPLGKPVLLVLIGGLALAAIAWGGAELFGESTDSNATIAEPENSTAGQNKPSDESTPPSDDQPSTNSPAENAKPQSGTGGDMQANPPADAPQ
jgi:hypothetical protein